MSHKVFDNDLLAICKNKFTLSFDKPAYIIQISQAFLFNTRNYSPEVINIQRCKVELNIILLQVNNFDIRQKKGMEYLFYYMAPAPNKIWEDKD